MQEKDLTLATPSDEMDAIVNDEPSTLGSEETNDSVPQTEENDNLEVNNNNDENPQTEDKDEYDDVWEKGTLEDIALEPQPEEENSGSDDNEEPEDQPDEKEQTQNGVVITKPLKYRGKEIWVKSEDEAIELMQKGLDYSFKMNKIKPHRSIVNIVEEAGLSVEDIKALADAKAGKQEAIKYLANKFGIELENNDDDIFGDVGNGNKANYQPEVEQTDPVLEIYQEIAQREPDVAGKVSKIWDELDPTFKQELYNPNIFRAFVGSVKTGEFDSVYPEVIKLKAINPAVSWLQAYQYVAQQLGSVQRQTQEPSEVVKPKPTKQVKKVKKSIKDSYDEIWDDKKSLEELEKEIFK